MSLTNAKFSLHIRLNQGFEIITSSVSNDVATQEKYCHDYVTFLCMGSSSAVLLSMVSGFPFYLFSDDMSV